MNCGKAKGQRKRTSGILICRNTVFTVAVWRKQCRNLSRMWSEVVQEACAGRHDLGCWGLNLKGQSGSQPVIFYEIWERNPPLFAALCKHHPTELPPPSKGTRSSYTGRGTVRRWVWSIQDCLSPLPVPGRISSSSSSSSSYPSGYHEGMTAICKAMPRAIGFCFRWVWWEILLFWWCSSFPASFHFFHWEEPWGCFLLVPALDKENLNHKLW